MTVTSEVIEGPPSSRSQPPDPAAYYVFRDLFLASLARVYAIEAWSRYRWQMHQDASDLNRAAIRTHRFETA